MWTANAATSAPSCDTADGRAHLTPANLIANLQKTGFFKNVEIKETFQDDAIKDMQAFQFTLTCEKGGASDTQSSKGKS